ncbi:GH92 family glycosyl hydrolase [Streptomyces sp. AM 3-1-1]|uniref:GH92 family glycosyl hydrolase n=1 Tax=Streptomyces sp. AM 3-1-1 TaxID=3028711 RepID=UPI0023B9F1D2|nr:GH92 family glycosyl hydrolase [Streptomyces sp. AM 3-1-1]WEH31419.1 GH92 family glycosyl hydrolase [Streptomyces sp. AM 3-1-1]
MTHRRSPARTTAGGLLALTAATALGLTALAPAATAATPQAAKTAHTALVRNPAGYVDPLIGSANAGNTYPGAVRPFGMLAFSPQTTRGNQVSNPAPGGYQYDATSIRGFSLTHLNGVGCSGANGDVPLMPYPGEVTTSPTADTNDSVYASAFSHDDEKASAGRYEVKLANGASAALTATERTGSGRFGFPADKAASFLVRGSNAESGSADARVHIDAAKKTVTGSIDAGNFCGPQSANNRKALYTLHYTIHFDTPFAKTGTWQDKTLRPDTTDASGGTGYSSSGNPVAGKGSGAYVTFPKGTTEVGAKVAISYVSDAGAEANLRAENPSRKSFESVARDAGRAWDKALGAIQVGGGTNARYRTFYTALYHSMLEPTLTSDTDGRYTGADDKTHRLSHGQKAQYGTFSGWDQYRAQVQLMSLLNPKAGSDYAQSLYQYASQRGGEWDRWLLQQGKTSVMSGDPAAPALAGIHAFGGTDFDVKGALKSLVRAATVPTANDSDSSGCNVECVGQRPGLDQYLKLGYVPADDCHCWGGAAETLEDTAADYGLSELARATGDRGNQKKFLDRSGNWTNVFDPAATPEGGYIRNRNADGTWAGVFTPGTGNGFVEGTSARYTWMVYSDVARLARAMGGNDKATARLDAFFRDKDGKFDFSAKDATRYDPTNEPDINTPYLYNYLGAPTKTQETVRAEIDQLWTDTPGGIPGNDDAGTMSSWYVFSALGMYPQNPSRADLVLTAPLFPRAVVRTGHGKRITVNAPAADDSHTYIHGLRVNGRTSTKTWVPDTLVKHGGTLDYTLATHPDTTWGTAASDAPPSFPGGGDTYFTSTSPSALKVSPGGDAARTDLTVRTLQDRAETVTWKADAPEGLTVTPASGTLAVPSGATASSALSVAATEGAKEGFRTIPVTLRTASGKELPGAKLTVTVAAKDSVLWNLNNDGVSEDDAKPGANFDGEGWSYSATALAEGGAAPGKTVTSGDFTFTLPGTGAGEPDNIEVAGGGQTLTVPVKDGATRLSLLGSAAEGDTHGTMTLTYTDGTTQQADLGFSDWTLGGGGDKPSFGNTVAVTSAYRDTLGGGKDPVNAYLFATAPVTLTSGKTLASVTLPKTSEGGILHVFAATTG